MRNKITTLLKKYIFVFVLLTFFAPTSLFAQTINAPTLYAPNNGALATFICANSTFYANASVEFAFTGGSLNGAQFVVELSDSSGSFATPLQLGSPTVIPSSPGKIYFNWPTTISGNSYKLRVKSITPAVVGATTSPFAAYYKLFNTGFWINNQVSVVNICGSGSFTLSIDNNTVADPSPVTFSTLKYKWYKNNVLIAGQTGTSINISTSGNYQVEIDYGAACNPSPLTAITKSQAVTVNIVAAGSTFTITSSLGNTFCSTSSTTLSTDAGYAYQWFRDGNSIPGATAFNYVTNQPGSYTVVVNQGSCSSTSNALNISTTTFNASIDVQEEPLTNIIAAGESKTITVTTDAASPTYEWYLDGVLLPETTNVLSTSIVGNYKVIIEQTTGCLSTKEFLFELKEGINPKAVPNLISPNADGKNDTWILPQEYINASTDVLIINPKGEVDFQTVNYQNNWPVKEIDFKSVNPVYYYIISKDGSPIKKGSITIIK
jgi:hypothetical protein